tara:strand:+ start:146 stop:289 length:144 start_codon:yes stop_codon:yes gene_type:complete
MHLPWTVIRYDRNPHAALDEGLPGFEHRFSSLKKAELAWVRVEIEWR